MVQGEEMARYDELRRLDITTRNKLRAILGKGDSNAMKSLSKLRGSLGQAQAEALDAVVNSLRHEKAVQAPMPFPKRPPFVDTVHPQREVELGTLLSIIEASVVAHKPRLQRISKSLERIDEAYADRDISGCLKLIAATIERDGWSHAILRRIVLIRENLPVGVVNDKIEALMHSADLSRVAVASLVQSYSLEQNFLTIKRSILNMADRGAMNRYSRTISKLPVQPFAQSSKDLSALLAEVERCSLVDAVILAKFNAHLFQIEEYPALAETAASLGRVDLFERLVATFDRADKESEFTFFKQSSAWLEYEPVRQYRILLDNYYDASREEVDDVPDTLSRTLEAWVGKATLKGLVGMTPFTRHPYGALSALELAGFATRSAIFNYWLRTSEGQIGFEKEDLLTLMGLTRDLARTVPIRATRTAARLAQDELVKLILLLLLAKRSKNELDSFLLKRLIEEMAIRDHGGSLLALVKSYDAKHPYVAEYIYDIATEDFLSKLNSLAPHRADIPEIRASLHEWMADVRGDEHYRQRARAVRIDHQLNRVRNEIDDHRIYVDPSRFSSWFEDEMLIELSSALTSTGAGKKGFSVNCDETLLALIVRQSYSAFCSNAVFGIASYIGRRIRHGTFHGHLYSSVINQLEKNPKFVPLFNTPQFSEKWGAWKARYNQAVEEIISARLHVHSKAKPLGLLQPDAYSPSKLEVLSAAVKSISASYVETKSTAGIDQTVNDYCWRLAECDLGAVTKYLRAQQAPLKNLEFLENEVLPAALPGDAKLADTFQRDLQLSIDRKLTAMFGWFKRPSIVAPKASVALLFDAIVAEVRDTIPDFKLEANDGSGGNDEIVGAVYHLVYDSLAVVVANAAKHGDRSRPARRRIQILTGKDKRLIVEFTSSIHPDEDSDAVKATIEQRKRADFIDANLYQGKSGISKLKLLQHMRHDFWLEQYEVVGNEVQVRLAYALEH
jgi:hypothetical protein